MKISAAVTNSLHHHIATVQTNGFSQQISVDPKSTGYGSSVNGGELLMLALATCFCNDLYREAKKQNLELTRVEVEVWGQFGADGEPGFNFEYKAKVVSDAPADTIRKLIINTDKVAEIQNTLRKGVQVKLLDADQ
jgi:uncharacterized OsmC-like protein